MFSCGWLPPVFVKPAGFILALAVAANGLLLFGAHRLPPTDGLVGCALLPTGA